MSPLLDTVGGIVKQNAVGKQIQTEKGTQQYLRLPLESARRLRWFDNADLNNIIRTHIREKQELIDLNDNLRKLLIEKGLVREDVLNQSLMQRIQKVDEGELTNQSVASALLISVQHELESLKERLQMDQIGTSTELASPSGVSTPAASPVCVKLCVNENQPEPVSLEFEVVDDEQMEDPSLQKLIEENKRLHEILQTMRERQKDPVESEAVRKAHDMCLKAEAEAREAHQQVDKARIKAAQSEEKEKAAAREAAELSKKLHQATEHSKRLLADHKRELEALNSDYLSKNQECKTLIQRNISLRTEMDDATLKLASYDALLSERNALESKVSSLEESLSELRVMAERGGHYRQITSEMEERVTELEQELLLTAQKVGNLEKQLKDAQQSLIKEQERNEKLMNKVRHLSTVEAHPPPEAFDAARETLIIELEAKQKHLTDAQASLNEVSHQLEMERTEKMKLLNDLSHLEDRFINVERNHATSTFQLKRQLSVARSELEECREYGHQLELERQSLCKKLHVMPDPNLGFEDTRGGGTFQDTQAMSDASCRNGLSAIDTLYLKNVLFKFIEAMVQDKTTERDMLLPAISTLLGASSEEFTKLKQTLSAGSSGKSNRSFVFWS